jgi:hypothetical protein
MKTKQAIQKEIEIWALNAARSVCSRIPIGQDVPHEEPDFLITHANGSLALETTELIIPGKNGGFPPVQEEAFHQKLVRVAEALHRKMPQAKPVRVSVRFNNGGRHEMEQMARVLAEFVSSRQHLASPVATFYEGFPALFFSVTIESDRQPPWTSSECCGFTVDDVYAQLALRIREKDKLLPTYRQNVPDTPMWLLIYTTFGVSRSMSMPHGIEQWKQPFGFDRVLFYSCLDGAVEEILPAGRG